MSAEFQVFISSTVEDLKPVRRKNAYGAGKPTPVGLSATKKA